MVSLEVQPENSIYANIIPVARGCRNWLPSAKVIRESQRIGQSVCQPLKFPETVDGRNLAPDNRYLDVSGS